MAIYVEVQVQHKLYTVLLGSDFGWSTHTDNMSDYQTWKRIEKLMREKNVEGTFHTKQDLCTWLNGLFKESIEQLTPETFTPRLVDGTLLCQLVGLIQVSYSSHT